MTLGTTIRRLREDRAWTQGQLSLHSGVDQSHLSKIERDVHDSVNAHVLARIATALGVTTDFLMQGAGWIESMDQAASGDPLELRLLIAVRSIRSRKIRGKVIEQLTWIAQAFCDAEFASGAKTALQKAAEEREEYEPKEQT